MQLPTCMQLPFLRPWLQYSWMITLRHWEGQEWMQYWVYSWPGEPTQLMDNIRGQNLMYCQSSSSLIPHYSELSENVLVIWVQRLNAALDTGVPGDRTSSPASVSDSANASDSASASVSETLADSGTWNSAANWELNLLAMNRGVIVCCCH